MTDRTDTLDNLVGLQPGDPLYLTRRRRDKVVVATEACHALFFAKDLASSLTRGERLLVARETARLLGSPAATHYAAELDAEPEVPPGDRRDSLLAFTAALSDQPDRAERAALQQLVQAGLSVADIVALAQLGGYLAYQLRLVAALRAMRRVGDTAPVAAPVEAEPFIHPAHLPPPGEPIRIKGFTSETLDWRAWLPVVDPAGASAEQLAVLDASHPKARSSDFYLLLAHQPRILSERSVAFNAIMYAPGGLSRAERELASTAVSCVNRCVYCASVHAQRYEQLARRNAVIAQLFTDVPTAGTNARERAIIQASITLTRAPADFGAEHVEALQAAGLSGLEVLDAVHAAALFGWANRLMLNLGEPVWSAG